MKWNHTLTQAHGEDNISGGRKVATDIGSNIQLLPLNSRDLWRVRIRVAEIVLSNAIARQSQSTSVFQLAYRKSVRLDEKCRQETENFHCPRGRYRHVSGDDSSPCLRDYHADSWPLCPKLVAMIDMEPKTLRKMKLQANHLITERWTDLRQR